jgi:DNA-3-methyladenine glycosylase
MPKPRRIRKSFFDRSVHEVAPDLIGATFLFRGVGGIIVEVEAYHHTTRRRIPLVVKRSATP